MPEPLRPHKLLGELLVQEKVLAPERLEAALECQRAQGGLLGQVLVRLEACSERDVWSGLARQRGWRWVSLKAHPPQAEAQAVLPAGRAAQLGVLPVSVTHSVRGKRLLAALREPQVLEAVEHAVAEQGYVLDPALCDPAEFRVSQLPPGEEPLAPLEVAAEDCEVVAAEPLRPAEGVLEADEIGAVEDGGADSVPPVARGSLSRPPPLPGEPVDRSVPAGMVLVDAAELDGLRQEVARLRAEVVELRHAPFRTRTLPPVPPPIDDPAVPLALDQPVALAPPPLPDPDDTIPPAGDAPPLTLPAPQAADRSVAAEDEAARVAAEVAPPPVVDVPAPVAAERSSPSLPRVRPARPKGVSPFADLLAEAGALKPPTKPPSR